MNTSGPCKFESEIICGVYRNQVNCRFKSAQECNDDSNHSINWLAKFKDPTIILQLVRYNHNRVPLTVIENQMCPECKIIWTDVPKIKACIICNMEE